MLGTGIYEHINPIANPVIKRADGHVYNAEEFGLRSRQDTHEIPRVTTAEQAAWVNSTYGELPQRMRVAVLQDDKAIINGLHVMRQRVGLKDWTMDFYEDPEAFLGSPKALQYDMVLTDVLIKNGGGRYLARQLRSRGYEGSIITISGFEASAHSGKSFFADGIDGMIERVDPVPENGNKTECRKCGASVRYRPRGRMKPSYGETESAYLLQPYRGSGTIVRWFEVRKMWFLDAKSEIRLAENARIYPDVFRNKKTDWHL